MGGKAGKHGQRSQGKQALPTSAERERFLRKREARKRKRASRAGLRLEDKWAKQFVDAKYKYVFVQVPMKGKVRGSGMGSPGQSNTGPASRLTHKTPVGDIVFGNDLNDLKWFDSKLKPTSSFQPAQRVVYPQLNKNGGVIVLDKNKGLPINLADGRPVDIDGVALKPSGGHVGFDVDHSAVASGQVDLDSMLNTRSGNLHPPASDLALEDSRMVTERRARYRSSKSPVLSSDIATKNRSVSDRGLESSPTKPKQSLSPEINAPSTPRPPRTTTPAPDIDTKIKGSRIRLPKGLILDLIVEFTIGAIISDLEQQIAKLTQEAIKRAWADKIYKIVQPQIEATIGLERHAREEINVKKSYIEVDWEVLLREQAEDFADAVVWFFKFSYGNPGFVELFEDVNYIGHKPVLYSRARQKPKRRRDRDDDTLIHEQHRQYILIWDEKIHLIAEMYREIALDAVAQLNVIHEEIKKVTNTLSSEGRSAIDRHLVNGGMTEINNALNEYNFKEAKRRSRLLIPSIRGQFHYYNALRHRERGTVKEAKVLQRILGNSSMVYMQHTRSLAEDEKNLLSMFLGQRFENLR